MEKSSLIRLVDDIADSMSTMLITRVHSSQYLSMQDALSKVGEYIASGSARVVFRVGNYAVKIAREGSYGVEDNITEYRVLSHIFSKNEYRNKLAKHFIEPIHITKNKTILIVSYVPGVRIYDSGNNRFHYSNYDEILYRNRLQKILSRYGIKGVLLSDTHANNVLICSESKRRVLVDLGHCSVSQHY